jgi:tRNA threonylcarbamoyladenosine biosynthesis protein TsaE
MQIYRITDFLAGDNISTVLHFRGISQQLQDYICFMELIYRIGNIDHAAKQLLTHINAKKVIAFSGEMGAGKTTLIQSICRQLGVKGTMGSPTFSIINEYETDSVPVYHIDLYRCANEEEAIRAGVEDCIYSGYICMVEWPERAPSLFPDDTIRIRINELDDGSRTVKVS